MRPRFRLAMVATAAVALLASAAASASAAPAPASAPHWLRPLPNRLYAPYYESYLAPDTPSITATAKASGAKFMTIAFMQSKGTKSCGVDWNSAASQPLTYYNADIASLRKLGGNVIPSFGGYSADTFGSHDHGTEIADSCTSVQRIAAVYEQVVQTLRVTRLDMDVESNAETYAAGINRRDEAIAIAQRWAARRGIRLQIQFTLPVEPSGLGSAGLSVLRNAIADGVRVYSVNIMVFDYYLPHEGVMNMSKTAIKCANAVHAELAKLYPQLSSRQIWRMEAMTMLPGISDFGKDETTTVHDARVMRAFEHQMHMNFLSIWAIQRDNQGPKGCVGQSDSNTCSGIKQAPWAFDHALTSFTQWSRW
jgi:Glycosyl hydrolases family 18